MIEPAKFTYSTLEKAFEKQKKTIQDKKKQIKTIKEHERKQVEPNALVEILS